MNDSRPSDFRPADTASVIAARQLAEEAHRRRLLSDLRRRRRRPLVVPPLPTARTEADPESHTSTTT